MTNFQSFQPESAPSQVPGLPSIRVSTSCWYTGAGCAELELAKAPTAAWSCDSTLCRKEASVRSCLSSWPCDSVSSRTCWMTSSSDAMMSQNDYGVLVALDLNQVLLLPCKGSLTPFWCAGTGLGVDVHTQCFEPLGLWMVHLQTPLQVQQRGRPTNIGIPKKHTDTEVHSSTSVQQNQIAA